MNNQNLEKISSFLDKHHVMSLATSANSEVSSCNLFYAFDAKLKSFVVASSKDTTHIKHILQNRHISGTVVLETKTVGKIQGVQFKGKFISLRDKELKKLYFKKFPYALALNPELWQIEIDYFKMTDNTLGFGKKLIWQDSSEQT